MNKKVIKMTESQLKDIVSKVIKEQGAPISNPNLKSQLNPVKSNQKVPYQVGKGWWTGTNLEKFINKYTQDPQMGTKGNSPIYGRVGNVEWNFFQDGTFYTSKIGSELPIEKGKWQDINGNIDITLNGKKYSSKTNTWSSGQQNCAPQLVDVTKGKILKFGCKTQGVKELQTLLDFTTPTGYFGNVTKKKVMDFQKNNNLKVDAIVGPETYKVLTDNAVAPPSQDVSEQGTTNTNLTVPEQTMLGFLNQFLKGEEGEFQNTPIEQLKSNMLFNSKTIYPMAQKLLEKKRTGKKTYDDKTFNALFLSMDKAITKEQRYQFFKDAANITNITYNSEY
jgi:hypothetical protein